MKESSIWLEAKSTFYINKEGKVVKHILDNREVDQEKQKSIVDSLKEKIVKKTNPALVWEYFVRIHNCSLYQRPF